MRPDESDSRHAVSPRTREAIPPPSLAEYIQRLVSSAPPLSEDQRAVLGLLLTAGGPG